MTYKTFEEISIGDIVSYNRVWGYVLARFDDVKQIKIVDEYTDDKIMVDYRRVQLLQKFDLNTTYEDDMLRQDPRRLKQCHTHYSNRHSLDYNEYMG